MDKRDVLSIPGIVIMLFIMIAMIMIGVADYQERETGPGPMDIFLDYSSTERAAAAHHVNSGRPSCEKEFPWK